MRALVLVMLPLLAGCSCNQVMTPDSGTDAGGADGNEISGDFIERFLLNDAGIATSRQQLAGRTINAFVENGDGGFDVYVGSGDNEGTFVVPGVPEGARYTLQVGAMLVNTSTRVVHLGGNSLGRPDSFTANPKEGLVLSASNLAPWTADDELQFISWGAGIGYHSTNSNSPPFDENAPDAGDTGLDASVIDFEGQQVPEAARGDDFFVVQLSGTRSDAGVLFKRATRALVQPVTLLIGMPTPMSGNFVELPQSSATYSFRAGEFLKHGADVNPAAEPFLARLLIDAHPGSFGRTTHTGGTPDLAIIELPGDAGDTSISFQYGNPYPSPWQPFTACAALFDVPYRGSLPDGGLGFPRSELGYVSMALEGTSTATPIAPLITPPRDVRLDGRSAKASLDGVSTTPVVEWQAPAVGTITRSEIEAIELTVATNGVTKRQLAGTLRIQGPATRVRLPPGFLNPQRQYLLRISNLTMPASYDQEWPLLDVGPPAGSAAALTASFKTTRP